ncbi:hypothetical protein R3P38DRAFT_3184681 [Favolaschia claudopus]|uniref:Uncharacterized protein n=1 Tax=Favolaschia claudopus TaxID=2862362 RepID=A0AAW0C8L9_9AGAR
MESLGWQMGLHSAPVLHEFNGRSDVPSELIRQRTAESSVSDQLNMQREHLRTHMDVLHSDRQYYQQVNDVIYGYDGSFTYDVVLPHSDSRYLKCLWRRRFRLRSERSKSDLGRSHKLYIVSIISLGSPDTLNIRTHATVHVCGVPSNIDKPNSTFDIKAEPYLSADNTFSVHCVFPRGGRSTNPFQGRGKSVSVEGLLAGV